LQEANVFFIFLLSPYFKRNAQTGRSLVCAYSLASLDNRRYSPGKLFTVSLPVREILFKFFLYTKSTKGEQTGRFSFVWFDHPAMRRLMPWKALRISRQTRA